MATSSVLTCASKLFAFGTRHILRTFSVHLCRNYSDSSKATVGFVGLGNMGGHMARNLLKNGQPLIVYDISAESCNSLKEAGATIAASPAEVASQANKIVTMLPSSPHVKAVYCGKDGIYSALQKGTLLMESSTIDPFVSKDVAAQADELGAFFVDSPVSGGVNGARDGLLTFMVGGNDDAFAMAKVYLDMMGKNVIHCGAVGTGQAAKICNNMLLAISMIGTSESMNLGMKLGLDPKMLASILNVSSGRCWSSELYNPVPGVKEGVPSSNDYKGGFGSALMMKDLGLAQSAAMTTKSPTPLGSLSLQLYLLMCNNGFAEKDFSSAFKFIQDMEN